MSWGCEYESWRRGRGRKARSWLMKMPSGRSEWQKRPLSICRRNLLPLSRYLCVLFSQTYLRKEEEHVYHFTSTSYAYALTGQKTQSQFFQPIHVCITTTIGHSSKLTFTKGAQLNLFHFLNILRISDQQETRLESSALFWKMSDLNLRDCTRYEYEQDSCVKNKTSAMSITFA